MVSKEQELYKHFSPPGKTPNEWCTSQQGCFPGTSAQIF